MLGRKAPSKGYKRVLNAHALLRRDGIEVDLVLIGPDEDGATVEGDGVHFLGRQPRQVILGALSRCLGLVNMSTSESFGIVICEAWLSGKPVIVNRACYAFRELIRDGEAGVLVSSDQELREAMALLGSDRVARDRLGMAGFAEVVTRYAWRDVANSVFNVLERDNSGAGSVQHSSGRGGLSVGARSADKSKSCASNSRQLTARSIPRQNRYAL